MHCLLKILEIDYFTDATKLILILNRGLDQCYVFVSSTAAVRLSFTAGRCTSRPPQPYLSRPVVLRLAQQSYVSFSSRTSRPAAVRHDQQPNRLSSRRTSRPTAVRLVQQRNTLSSSRTPCPAAVHLVQQPIAAFSSRAVVQQLYVSSSHRTSRLAVVSFV